MRWRLETFHSPELIALLFTCYNVLITFSNTLWPAAGTWPCYFCSQNVTAEMWWLCAPEMVTFLLFRLRFHYSTNRRGLTFSRGSWCTEIQPWLPFPWRNETRWLSQWNPSFGARRRAGILPCCANPGAPWRGQWTHRNHSACKSKGRILVLRCTMDKSTVQQCSFQRCSKTSSAALLLCLSCAQIANLYWGHGRLANSGIHRLQNAVSVKKQGSHLLQSPACSTAGTGRHDARTLEFLKAFIKTSCQSNFSILSSKLLGQKTPSDTIYIEILNPMESSKRGFLSLKPRK